MRNNDPAIFYIWFKGQPIPEELRGYVTRFEYEDCEDKEDELLLDFKTIPVQLLDHAMFAPGAELKVKWGYVRGAMSEEKVCIVKEPDYNYADVVTFTLRAYDKSNHMKGGAANKVWKKQTYTAMANVIAKKHGLKFSGEDSKEVITSISQTGKSDWQFLLEIAKKANFICYVKGDTLHFKARNLSQKAVNKVTYRKDRNGVVLSVNIKYNTHQKRGAKTQVTAVGINPTTGKPISHTANARTKADQPRHSAMGSRTLLVDGATGQTKWVNTPTGASAQTPKESGRIVPRPMPSAAAIKQAAESEHGAEDIKMIEGELRTTGLPHWNAMTVTEIGGLGKKMSGNYYMSNIRHTIDGSGYVMSTKIMRNAQNNGGPGSGAKTVGKVNVQKAVPKPPKVVPKTVKVVPKPTPKPRLYVDGNTGETVNR